MALAGRFGPPLALMGVIFYLSSVPGLATDLGVIDTILRKGAHMTEFGLLFLLWWRALGWPRPAAARVACAIALAYAVSDEIHQSFVRDRHGSAWDVAIDAAGVGLAALVAVLWLRRVRPARRDPPRPPSAGSARGRRRRARAGSGA